MTNLERFDMERPTLEEGETLCSACWAVTRDNTMWLWIGFKYLDPVWLCPDCQPEHADDMLFKQSKGL